MATKRAATSSSAASRKLERQSKPPRVKKPKVPPPPKGDIGTKTAHAKWPAMYKRHLGMIETHIKTLDRVMQSMRSNMQAMPERERGEWERGERGNWGVICGMMNRATGALRDARAGGEGILPERFLKEKKSVATMGPVAAAYTGPTVRPKGGEPTAEDFVDPTTSDPEPGTDTSSSDSENEDVKAQDDEPRAVPTEARRTKSPSPAPAPAAAFVPLTVGKKRKLSTGAEEAADGKGEANKYFVVDTEPTPISTASNGKAVKKSKKKHVNGDILDGEATKSKKRSRDEGTENDVGTKKNKVGKDEKKEKVDSITAVDFEEVERQLRDEVHAAMAAQAAKKAEKAEKKEKKEKKRKRDSDGATSGEVVVKKSKKEKRSADAEAGEGENAVPESSGKKEKKRKRKPTDE